MPSSLSRPSTPPRRSPVSRRSRLRGRWLWTSAAVVAAAIAASITASIILGGSACGRGEPARISITAERDSLSAAYCQATVAEQGSLDIEGEYLPAVVTCENGAADYEALKAQAVAARSYLYYRLDRVRRIGDSQRDQVYTCARSASALARRAVAETSGQVLLYQGTQVAAFYVAGALQDSTHCTGSSDDPTSTEAYVTYNRGKSGDAVSQTHLGALHGRNHANRGCMSQNGSHCLAAEGWRYDDILRFYYGHDIELVQVEGPCIQPIASLPGPPARSRDGRRLRRGLAGMAGLLVIAGIWWRLRRRRARF